MAAEKVILDTDVGDAIDDALALRLLLLSCPEVELVAVTIGTCLCGHCGET